MPYGVILSVGIFDNGNMKYHNEKLDYHSNLLSIIELDGGYYSNNLLCRYSQFTVKPYLRPMSSMTENENKELFQLMGGGTDIRRIDFYISHHLDFRGLIETGLALEAPKGMYKY